MAAWTRSAAAIAAVSALLSLVLHGCDFSSGTEVCDGATCDCYPAYYGLDAYLQIGGTPIEHASRRFHLTTVAQDTQDGNSSSCCFAIVDEIQAQLEGKAGSQMAGVCSSCKGSPNADVAAAAQTCGGPSFGFLGALLGGRTAAQGQDGPEPAPPSSDEYDDCNLVFSGAEADVSFAGKAQATAVQEVRLRWTDKKNTGGRCCQAIKKQGHALFVLRQQLPKAERSEIAGACKGAYNAGIALAAYRWPDEPEPVKLVA